MGKSIVGSIATLKSIPHDALVVGIGDNETRMRLFAQLSKQGEKFITIVHPDAVVAGDARLGAGTVVFAGAIVNANASVGDNVILNTGCSVDHDCVIGSHSHICPGVHLGGTVCVGEGAFVGIASTVIHNKTIGEWSTVGAGAVIIRDVVPRTTVVGVPGRLMPKQSHKSVADNRDLMRGNNRAVARSESGVVDAEAQTETFRSEQQKVAIYGAGGFGREVAVAIKSAGKDSGLVVVCYVDDNAVLEGKDIEGMPVLDLVTMSREHPDAKILCAIADPLPRQDAIAKARSLGIQFTSYIHGSASVNPTIRIGEGCIVSAGCILTSDIVLGDFVILNLQSTIGHDVVVGDYSTVGPGVRVGGFVRIQNRVRVGMGALIVNGVEQTPLVIGEGAYVGAGACVLKSVPAGQTVFGSPARPVPSVTIVRTP
jgi:sugar O-acyltransferase (sialic acid O-acetyltransferase NeuD family)